jgi:hypothetical protein
MPYSASYTRPKGPQQRCPVANKTRYRDVPTAYRRLLEIAASDEAWAKNDVPARAYPCKHCGGAHLSHKRPDATSPISQRDAVERLRKLPR